MKILRILQPKKKPNFHLASLREHVKWLKGRSREGRVVNVYRKYRAYGGSEEGGWWYTAYKHIYSLVGISHRHADYIKKRLSLDNNEAAKIEGSIGYLSNKPRPHYC